MRSNKQLQFKKMRTHVIKRMFLRTFPVKEEYYETQWANWESRIKKGQKEEIADIARITSDWPDEDAGDRFADDYYHLVSVTDNMYAALIVSIWSKMESYFKGLIKFCDPSVDPPYAMKDIKRFFNNAPFNIDLETISDYETIDGIRLLNNAFKHTNSKYKPDHTKSHTIINADLLIDWKISKGEKIEYSELSVENLLIACNAFTTELFGQVETEINNRASGSGGS